VTAPNWLRHPTGLSRDSQEIWAHYAPGLRRNGSLTAENAEVLKAACRALAVAKAAEGQIEAEGVLIRSNTGIRKNPAVGVLFEAQRAAQALLKEFRLA
jgi:P27 family predicted phage terminase small subunit